MKTQRKREHRVVPARELRVARTENGQLRIEGYAAVFNSPSQDLGGFLEVIRPGAFVKTLQAGADVRALFNHDENNVLGRTKSGTLELAEDATGLHFICSLPDTQMARDLAVSMERGDIDQCSFGFYCLQDEWKLVGEDAVRFVQEADLFDVSVVTYPAYLDTSAAVRSLWRDGQPESIREGIETAKKPRVEEANRDNTCKNCSDNCFCSDRGILRARMRVLLASL